MDNITNYFGTRFLNKLKNKEEFLKTLSEIKDLNCPAIDSKYIEVSYKKSNKVRYIHVDKLYIDELLKDDDRLSLEFIKNL